MLNQLEKLANILNAKIIFINSENNQFSNENKQTNIIDSNRLKKLISKINLHSDNIYQAYLYSTGYFLCVHIKNIHTIVFWFDYNDDISNYNELMLINTLTNLDTIVKIIYSLDTLKDPPNQKLSTYHLEEKEDALVSENSFDLDILFRTETSIIKAIIYSQKDSLIKALDQFSKIKILDERLLSKSPTRSEKNYLIFLY